MNKFSISSGCGTKRMPLPPPPATALIITGYPIASAISLANSIVSTMPSLPGITGMPEAFIVSLATDLLPILAIA